MSGVHYSFCTFHLGDNIIHLNFLRALSKKYPELKFVHAVMACHLKQLLEVVEDLPNIELADYETDTRFLADDAQANPIRNVWKAAFDYWPGHRLRNDWSGFYLEYFKMLAAEMDLECPFNEPKDLLFDYPNLNKIPNVVNHRGEPIPTIAEQEFAFDFLAVNSQPCSGQLRCFDRIEYLDPLIQALCDAGKSVLVTRPTTVVGKIRMNPEVLPSGQPSQYGQLSKPMCTHDIGLTISGIGAISRRCRHHIMVSTGPSWPTFNVCNEAARRSAETPLRHRIVLLEHEQLNLPGITQMANLEQVMAFGRQEGWF